MKVIKGYSVTPSTLVNDTGDIDCKSFFAGHSIEDALYNLIDEDEMFECEGCREWYDEKEEAEDCELEHKELKNK